MERDENAWFGELRSLARREPGQRDFWRICKAIEQMWRIGPERVNAEVVPYMEGALARWPSSVRDLPAFWRGYLLEQQQGAPFGPLALVRRVNLAHQLLGERGARALSEREELSIVSMVDVTNNGFDGAMVARVFEAPWMRGLRDVRVSMNELDAASLGAIVVLPELEELRAWDVGVGDEVIEALEEMGPQAPGLRALWLCNNPLTHRGLSALGRSRWCEGLERLDVSGVTAAMQKGEIWGVLERRGVRFVR